MQPRMHRRKSLHPHRAPFDALPTSAPPLHSVAPRSAHSEPRRASRTPDRIHVRKTALGKSRASTASPALGGGTKECFDCHTLKTPMWRRVDGNIYCNACGLRRTRAMVGR